MTTTQLLSPAKVRLDSHRLPRHVAVIMDGNGRWATQQGLPRVAGHRQGVETLKGLLRWCKDFGIEMLTAFAFSTENWQRPTGEVAFLMALFERLLRTELDEMHREGVRMQFIGDRAGLPNSLQQQIQHSILTTAANQAIQFNVAINYGSRQEIVRACRRLAIQVQRGELQPEAITDQHLAQGLDTANLPDPDLLIRTSGEMRLSNYLLWQLAYTELYFTPILWPDFTQAEFLQALVAYQRRDRRFGTIKP